MRGLSTPVLCLDTQGTNQPQSGFGVRKDADDQGSALDLFVESFEHVGALQVFVVRPGKAVEAQSFADVGFDPIDQSGVLGQPSADPCDQDFWKTCLV